jgi:hypothetical protein
MRMALALLARLPPARLCAGDAAYDSDRLRQFLIARGTEPVIPNNPNPQALPTLRPDRLQKAQSHRAHVLPAEGLAPNCDPL